MQGKTVVITGATSGIGEAGATALAKMGARIVFVARNPDKGEALLTRLAAANPEAEHAAHYADLSSLTEMKRVGAAIAAAEPVVDVLLNNAGAIFNERSETVDKLERTFATNHMSYFVITNALLESLKAAPDARVVSTSSIAHLFGGPLNFYNLQMRAFYDGMRAYGRSKLCNILFTRELARRMKDTSVIAACYHPGWVASNFGQDGGWLSRAVQGVGDALGLAIPPEKGADTMVWLASAPREGLSPGGYYDDRRLGFLALYARDDAAARRLWAESERIAA